MSNPRDMAPFFPISLLGIPITNLPLTDAASESLQRIQDNKRKGKVSYYTVINDFLIDTSYGWQPTAVMHPELLSILRNARFSSFSGKFLANLGRLLGSPIAPFFTAEDYTHALCQSLAEKKMGIFFLGDNEKIIKATAIRLHDKHMQLRLVGITAPPIFVEGRDLETTADRDALLVEQINASHADVLIINLDSLAQELWFERVKGDLTTPFVLMAGTILTQSAPPSTNAKHVQREVQRDTQSKSAASNTSLAQKCKLLWMACPLVVYHNFNRFCYETLSSKQPPSKPTSKLFLSAHHSIAVILLPRLINSAQIPHLRQLFEESASHDVLLFDFREVRHIQPEGFHFLMKSWLARSENDQEIYGFQPTQGVQRLMKWHRTWDLFQHTICESPEALLSRLKSHDRATFYDTFSQTESVMTMSVLGALNNQIDYAEYINKLMPIIGTKNCRIDFSYCSFIDNTGFAFLLNIRKRLLAQQRLLTISGLSPTLKSQFQAASVLDLFRV
jgi:N-acetylglucosaminyldiphosphoundecaprenol N-acetyl-beta-D-mannosaminyltransferase